MPWPCNRLRTFVDCLAEDLPVAWFIEATGWAGQGREFCGFRPVHIQPGFLHDLTRVGLRGRCERVGVQTARHYLCNATIKFRTRDTIKARGFCLINRASLFTDSALVRTIRAGPSATKYSVDVARGWKVRIINTGGESSDGRWIVKWNVELEEVGSGWDWRNCEVVSNLRILEIFGDFAELRRIY